MVGMAFQPDYPAAVYNISVTGTAATTAIPGGQSLRFCNYGSDVAYVKFLQSEAETGATTDSTPIPAGVVEVMQRPDGCAYISCISDTTTSLHLTAGRGM